MEYLAVTAAMSIMLPAWWVHCQGFSTICERQLRLKVAPGGRAACGLVTTTTTVQRSRGAAIASGLHNTQGGRWGGGCKAIAAAKCKCNCWSSKRCAPVLRRVPQSE